MIRPGRLRAAVLLSLTPVTGSTRAQAPGGQNAMSDFAGIDVRHFSGGVTQRGCSPGTRQTGLVRPDSFCEIAKTENVVDEINADAQAAHAKRGKFAGQLICDGAARQARIIRMCGPLRVGWAPHHGPSPHTVQGSDRREVVTSAQRIGQAGPRSDLASTREG